MTEQIKDFKQTIEDKDLVQKELEEKLELKSKEISEFKEKKNEKREVSDNQLPKQDSKKRKP